MYMSLMFHPCSIRFCHRSAAHGLSTPTRPSPPRACPTQNSKLLPPPPHAQHPRRHEHPRAHRVGTPGEHDQPPIVAPAHPNQPARDGYARQTGERRDRVAGGVVPPVVLDAAQLAHAHGGEGDAAAGREAEDQRENDDERRGGVGVGGEPQGPDGQEAQRDGEDERVEAAHPVGDEAREVPAQTGSGVEDGDELVREPRGDVVRDGVGGEVG